jgi:hypothetical protein
MVSGTALDCWEREAQASGSPDSERVLALIAEVRRLDKVIRDALPEVEKLVKAYGKVAALSLDGLLENVRLKSSKHGPTKN